MPSMKFQKSPYCHHHHHHTSTSSIAPHQPRTVSSPMARSLLVTQIISVAFLTQNKISATSTSPLLSSLSSSTSYSSPMSSSSSPSTLSPVLKFKTSYYYTTGTSNSFGPSSSSSSSPIPSMSSSSTSSPLLRNIISSPPSSLNSSTLKITSNSSLPSSLSRFQSLSSSTSNSSSLKRSYKQFQAYLTPPVKKRQQQRKVPGGASKRPSDDSNIKSRKQQTVSNSPMSTDLLESINKALAEYFDPIAVGIGLAGNVIILLGFLATPMRARPLSHVLAGLGISDFLYAISCLLVYLSTNGKAVYDAPGVCHVTMFAAMFSRSLQAWYILMAHLDRINAHFQSSYERRKRRVFNTQFALIMMALLAVAMSVHVLWSFETVQFRGQTYCVPIKDSMEYYIIIRKVNVVLSVIVPLAIIGVIDCILLLKLSLYFMCKDNYDDEYEDDILEPIGQNGRRNSGGSSFCTDKIVRFPLQERKYDACESNFILTNGAPGNPDVPSNLATIREIPSENHSSPHRSFSRSWKAKDSSSNNNSNTNNNQNTIIVDPNLEFISDRLKEKGDDNGNHSKMFTSSSKNREVAKYILTLSEDYISTKHKEKDSLVRFTIGTKEQEQQDLQQNIVNDQNTTKCGRKSSAWTKSTSEGDIKSRFEPFHSSPGELRRGRSMRTWRKQNNSRLAYSCSQYSESPSEYNNTFKSGEFTSFANSNVSRSTIIPEDHMFADDTTACSIVTVFSGLILAIFTIPSSYTEGKSLFFHDSTPPSIHEMNQAIFFETMVKFNYFYKILLYVIALDSFRHALTWMLTRWVGRLVTSSSRLSDKFRSSALDKDNNVIVYV